MGSAYSSRLAERELRNSQVGDCCYDLQHGHIIVESREELLEGGVAAGTLTTTHSTQGHVLIPCRLST